MNWLAQQENLIAIRPRDPRGPPHHADGRPGAADLLPDGADRSGPDPARRRPDLVAEAVDARRCVPSWCCWWSRALGGYLYFDSKREPGDRKKQEKVFADVEADKIEQLTVKSAAGEQTTVAEAGQRAGRSTQPAGRRPDEAEISGITSNLASLEVQRVVDEQASDFKQYGLDPARIEVTFKAGGQDRNLLIGQKTPTGTDLYARLADKPRVFLISSYLESTFNKSAFDLRDKTILKIDRDKVDSVEVDHAGTDASSSPSRAPTGSMTAPVDARADFSAVEGDPRTAEHRADESHHGRGRRRTSRNTDSTQPAATVHLGSGSSQAGLAIGKSAGEGVVYAKDVSRPMVFTIESAIADELKKPADDFRVKDLFDARCVQHDARGGRSRRPDHGLREIEVTSQGDRAFQGRLEAGRSRVEGRRRRQGGRTADGADERASHIVRRQVDPDGARDAGARRHDQVRGRRKTGTRHVRPQGVGRVRTA